MNTNVSNTKLDISEVPELAVDDQQASNDLRGDDSEEKKHIQKKRRYSQIGILILFIIIIATTVGLVVHYTKQDTGTSSADSKDSEQQVATDYPETVEPSISTSDNAVTQAPTDVISASTTKPSETTTFTEEGTFPPLTYESGIPTVWGQVGEDIYGPNPNMYFGHSVSASYSGTLIIVGAPGDGTAQVYQFDFSAQAWHRLGQTLGGTLQDDADDFGYAVSMSDDGKVIGISAPNHNEGTGKVYLYALDPLTNEWMIAQELEGESRGDGFGASISLCGDGSTVAVGALQKMIDMAGYVKVHKCDNETIDTNTAWLQLGDTLEGEESGDRFGSSVALSNDGRTIIVGAPLRGEDGQAYVFHHNRSSGKWDKFGRNGKLLSLLNLKRSDGTEHKFGSSVMISSDGKIIAVTSPGSEHRGEKGITKVFKLHEKINMWKKLGNNIVGHRSADYPGEFFQGTSLSNSGTIIAIGSWGYSGGTGVVRIYEYLSDRDRWDTISQDIFGKVREDKFGWSISLSGNGNTIVVGGPENDGNGFNSGHVRSYHRANCSCIPASISIVIQLDKKPSETGWLLDCERSGIVHRVNPGYYDELPNELVVHTLSVLEGDNCTITVEDFGGDGLNIKEGFTYEVYYGIDIRNSSNRLSFYAGKFSNKSQSTFLTELTYKQWVQAGEVVFSYARSASMSSSGHIVVVGDSSRRYTQVLEFDSSSNKWNNLGQALKHDSSGDVVAISGGGTVVATSGPTINNYKGRVFIYTLNKSRLEWILDQELNGDRNDDYFGSSLSISGDGTFVAVGALHWWRRNSGYVKIFQQDANNNSHWGQIGDTLQSVRSEQDRFGSSVALSYDGSKLVVGAGSTFHDGPGYVEIYMYEESANTWSSFGDNNIIFGDKDSNRFGDSVAISKDGDVIAVTEPFTKFGYKYGRGSVKVYRYDSGKNKWSQLGNAIQDAYTGGVSLSDSGMTLAVDGINKGERGARVFKFDPGTDYWAPLSQIIDGDAVSLNGNGSLVLINSWSELAVFRKG